MISARSSIRLLLGGVLVLALAGLTSCASAPGGPRACGEGVLPTYLPSDPEPCTKYCPVWVPPVYRDVPRLRVCQPGCAREVPETVLETCYTEICVKPGCTYPVRTPDVRCEQAVVQTKPGGYKWKLDECGCWRYCYEPATHQWCNKVVTEEGIEYCTERSPEYRVQVTHRPVTRFRQVYEPGTYAVEWTKECYQPGHWEWQPIEECCDCDCPGSHPLIPFRRKPCNFVSPGTPRTN